MPLCWYWMVRTNLWKVSIDIRWAAWDNHSVKVLKDDIQTYLHYVSHEHLLRATQGRRQDCRPLVMSTAPSNRILTRDGRPCMSQQRARIVVSHPALILYEERHSYFLPGRKCEGPLASKIAHVCSIGRREILVVLNRHWFRIVMGISFWYQGIIAGYFIPPA